jgi:predicted nucleotidyltransferase
MIYLKMFSVHDRPDARRKKDTGDIQFVLKNYLAVTGQDRLLSSGRDRDVMELAEGDLEVATARIAGRDIGNTLNDLSAQELAEILRIETVSETRKPIAQELAGFYRGDFGRARKILTSLKSGFSEVRGYWS